MKRLSTFIALASLALATDAAAAPAGIPERAVDLDLKEADIGNVFSLLGHISGRTIMLDPCVVGSKVDLRLKNTPLPIVFDALALKLQLVYEDDGAAVNVRCAGTNAAPPPRVSLEAENAPLADVATRLAADARLAGVDYRATARPEVTVTLKDVRFSTAIVALADAGKVHVSVVKNRLVISDAP